MEQYSVLMSVYAKENPDYLAAAMDSMFTQSIPTNDFVLVCDGPLTAALNAAIISFQERYGSVLNVIRLEENCGLGTALQAGLPFCKNELVARMDSDDISVKNRMELLLPEISENASLAAVGGQIAEFQGNVENVVDERKVPLLDADIKERMKYRNPMNHVTTLLRKSAVITVGGYISLNGFEDYYLWARLSSSGYLLKNIDAICVYVRTDNGMYRRRGGMEYFQSIFHMERCLRQMELINNFQYVINVMARSCAAAIPNGLRKFLYMHFLRKRRSKNE